MILVLVAGGGKEISMGTVMRNFLYNAGYQILCIIIPLITMPYLAYRLGAGAIGINSYTNSVISLFTTFGLLGLTNYSSREIACSNAEGQEELSKTFISLCVIRCMLLAACMCIYLPVSFLSEYTLYFLLQIFLLLYNFLDISWLFVGIEEMRTVVIRNSIVKIASTAMIFLSVRQESDLGRYIIINGGGMLAGACIMFPQAAKYIRRVHVGREDITKHIVPALRLFLPQAASSIYVMFDKTMIKWLTGEVVSVGFYDQSQMIVRVPTMLAGSLSTVMLPRISYEYCRENMGQIKKYLELSMNLIVTAAYPIFSGLAGIAPTLIHWYLGGEFLECISLLQMSCIIILPVFITNVTGVMYLMGLNKTKELTVSYASAAMINLVVNMLFIPSFGAYGAVFGTICAEFTVLCIQYHYMKIHIGSMHLARRSVKSIFSSVIMLFFVWQVGRLLGNGVMSTIAQVLAGGAVYILCMWLMRDSVIKDFVSAAHGVRRWKGKCGEDNL